MKTIPKNYPLLLKDIKERIQQAQVRAVLSANQELILLYWEIGRLLVERREHNGWGTGVIPQLATDLKNELPEVRGFSERNLKRMTQFFKEYPKLYSIGPQAVARIQAADNKEDIKRPQAMAQLKEPDRVNLQQHVAQLPWGHNILLIQKVKNLQERVWYMRQTIENGWSRNILDLQIKNKAYKRAAKAVTNFERTLLRLNPILFIRRLKTPIFLIF